MVLVFVMIISIVRSIFAIGKCVERQIICHSTENMSKGLFLRPVDIDNMKLGIVAVSVNFRQFNTGLTVMALE